MRAIDRLKRDHEILRSKLNVLEAALKMGTETWFVLREVCFTLSKQLRDHIEREEALIAACRNALPPEAFARLATEHHDEPHHLEVINRLFVKEHGHTTEQIRPALAEVIRGLRAHMADEEATLFPTLERVLVVQEEAQPAATATPPSRLDEVMTVNRVIQQYPTTKSVFERLFVNIPYEGCHCLDEIAWRHGMDSRELLKRLEQVITTAGVSGASPRQQVECCGCQVTT